MTLPRGRVVFVVPDFEPTVGGTTRQTANEARALLARGYDALVVTQRTDPSWPREETRDGLRVVRLGPRGRGAVAMKLHDACVALWLRRNRAATAIVHVVMYPDYAVASVFAGCGPRTVMAWAGVGDATEAVARHRLPPGESSSTLPPVQVPEPLRVVLRRLRRRVLDRGGITHTVLTRAMGGELDQVLGGHEPHVIPTPVDTDAYRPASTAERAAARQALGLGEEVAVVYAGHLRASKRVDRLIDAVGRLHADGHATRLFVLGDSRPELDDCTVALRRQVTTAGLDEQVIFTGAVPDVRPYLHAADVFVLPSEREGLSNALLEALACGVPCVAPAAAGGDQILDATCGAVPASASPEALAAAIVEVTGPQHHALAAGARRIAASYSVDAVAGEYERLYARIGVSGNESARARRRRQ